MLGHDKKDGAIYEKESPHQALNLKTPDCLILKLLVSKTSIGHSSTTSYIMFMPDRIDQGNTCGCVPFKDNS